MNVVDKFKLIHGDKYDYSRVSYINSKTKVVIGCRNHNPIYWFEQTPANHLQGQGCSLCFGKRKYTTDECVEKFKLTHGDKYDYSRVNYINSKTKVIIGCKEHGWFEQLPKDHMRGIGCPKCGNSIPLTTEEFIEKAKLIHDYDYSKTNYINRRKKVIIGCRNHNPTYWFEQTPADHLSGCGCPKCNISKGEEKIRTFLSDKNIDFKTEYKFNDLKFKSYLRFDFYIPSKNILIEYNGIQHYKRNHFNDSYKDFLLNCHRDWLKRNYAKKHNIKLIIIPYTDIKNIDKILLDELKLAKE